MTGRYTFYNQEVMSSFGAEVISCPLLSPTPPHASTVPGTEEELNKYLKTYIFLNVLPGRNRRNTCHKKK